MSRCPNCGCPYATVHRITTADMPRTWQDNDGKWHQGHANDTETGVCNGCGRTLVRVWEFGKLVREDVTNHGRPTGGDGDG